MSPRKYRYVFLGLSITSSCGNGHATTYRSLVRELVARGHEVLFLERDLPLHAASRDLPDPTFGRTVLYGSLEELFDAHRRAVAEADMVVVGSSVPDGCVVGSWACDVAPGRTAFYDIDTPITLGMIDEGRDEYISRALLRRYSLYLSFTGGPTLKRLEDEYGAACARALYGSVDPEIYRPHAIEAQWDLGYLGAYSDDRRRGLEHLMFEPARRVSFGRFIVAGAHYPEHLPFPANVEHVAHLPAAVHAAFYSAQRYTLNVTRGKMVACGWSPSGRLFEAAACGTPIISDPWPGLEEFFFPGREILVASSPEEVVRLLVELPEHRRESMAQAARARVFREHTAAHRAAALERYTHEVFERQAATRRATRPAVATALDAWPELRNASGGDAA